MAKMRPWRLLARFWQEKSKVVGETGDAQDMMARTSMANFLSSGPHTARNHILLAHGAGAPITSPFMEAVAGVLATGGIRVHRFEFEYMSARRTGGTRKPPPKAELLAPYYRNAVQLWTEKRPPGARLFIGGKSMGGRVASLVAGDLHRAGTVGGLLCLGYPFHPPGKPDQLRIAHLLTLDCPALIVQGTHDPFGTQAEIASYALPRSISFHWVAQGNHDLTPPARSGRSFNQEIKAIAAAIIRFAGR